MGSLEEQTDKAVLERLRKRIGFSVNKSAIKRINLEFFFGLNQS